MIRDYGAQLLGKRGSFLYRALLGFVAALVLCLGVSVIPVIARANSVATFDVADYGALPDDGIPDGDAINSALREAATYQFDNEGDQITVHVSAGTYDIDRVLKIYSNTILQLEDGAVFNASFASGNMLDVGHVYNDPDTGELIYCNCEYDPNAPVQHGGYSQIENIVVTGGVWDRDPNGDFTDNDHSVFMLRHGQNITISNTELAHSTDHILNLSGTNNVTVDNVILRDNRIYTATDSNFWGEFAPGDVDRFTGIEAIHLDYMNEEGGERYPWDDTPCQNITITGCTLSNVFDGIGSHHLLDNPNGDKTRANGITVSNCHFANLAAPSNERPSSCVRLYSADNSSVTGITTDSLAAGVLVILRDTNNVELIDNSNLSLKCGLARLFNSTNTTLKGNTAQIGEGSSFHGVEAHQLTGSSFSENVIKNAGKSGFVIQDSSNVTMNANIIESPKESGLIAQNSDEVFFVNNEVMIDSSSKKHGVYGERLTNSKVSGNSISDAGLSGIYFTSVSDVDVIDNTIVGPHNSAFVFEASSGLAVESNALSGIPITHDAFLIQNTSLEAKSNTISGGRRGISVRGESNPVTLENNSVSGTAEYGIHVMEASMADIRGNTIVGSGTQGIYVSDAGTNVAVTGNNKVFGSGGSGIQINAGAYATIDGNTVTKNADTSTPIGGAGIFLNGAGSGCIVENNTISDTTNAGMEIRNTEGVTVQGNTVSETGNQGLIVRSSKNTTVKSNTITKYAGHGIYVYGSDAATPSSATIHGNTVKDAKSASGKWDINIDKNVVKINDVDITNNTLGSLGYRIDASSGRWNNTDGVENPNGVVYDLKTNTTTSVSGIVDKTYTGSPLTQSPVVKVRHDANLASGTDYTLGYRNNINNGTATVIIKGKGNYSNSLEKTFKITGGPTPVAPPQGKNSTYDGTAKTGVANGTGYTVTNGKQTNAGTYTATVKLKNNYVWSDGTSDDKTVKWTINPATLTATYQSETVTYGANPKLVVNVSGFVNGETAKTAAGYTAPTVAKPSSLTVADSPYTLTPKGGKASNYKFTHKSGKLTVTPAKVAIPVGITGLTYTGDPQIGVKTGAHYTLNANKATNAKSYTTTARLADAANYTWTDGTAGPKYVKWSIKPASVTNATVTGIANKTYNGKAQFQAPEVEVDGRTLQNGTDYDLSYENNTHAGTATVTITAKGNYTGTIGKTFTINKLTLTPDSVVYTTKYGDKYHLDGCHYLSTSKIKTTRGEAEAAGKEPCTTCITDDDVTFKNDIKVTSIKVTGNATMNPGTTQTLKLAVGPSNATNKGVTWKSSNTNLATIDANGKVTAKKAGKVTFTATAKDGSKKSGSFTVTIRTPSVSYRTHVQMEGWQNYVKDGEMSGTSGKAYRLEGINIKLANASGGITYRTHVQNIGWQDYVSNGAMAGTSGKAYRLEAIEIYLTGEIAKYYDVYYRVHCQNIGWMGWAKGAKGSYSGTAGYAYRLEGIQIVLVPKNAANTSSPMPPATVKGITQATKDTFRQK